MADANEQILTIRWISGKLEGKEEFLSRRETPINIGRTGCNAKIEIPSNDVSRKHGRFMFRDEDGSWFYSLNGDRTTNGSWEAASFYDIENKVYEEHEGTLLQEGNIF